MTQSTQAVRVAHAVALLVESIGEHHDRFPWTTSREASRRAGVAFRSSLRSPGERQRCVATNAAPLDYAGAGAAGAILGRWVGMTQDQASALALKVVFRV